MKKITKLDTTHAKYFGINGVSEGFYLLIDRLQKHSEWKYPERKWTNDTYYGIAFQWIGKDKELEERVAMLESEMETIKKAKLA